MKCLNCIVEKFALNVYYDKVDAFAKTHEELYLVFEVDNLEVFPTITLNTMQEKTSLLDDFIKGMSDRTILTLSDTDTINSDYINTVNIAFEKVATKFVKVVIDLTMYDFEYKYLCQSFYNIGLDTLSMEDLTISRNYTYLTTLSEVEKFNEYIKSYQDQ